MNDIEIVGEAGNGDNAFALVQEVDPNVLLLDFQMPGMPAREVEKEVRVQCPDVITLILTAHDRDAYLADFMDLGVSGYLDKKGHGNQLVNAIYRADYTVRLRFGLSKPGAYESSLARVCLALH